MEYETRYYVFRRHSDCPRLDGYVGATCHMAGDSPRMRFEILFESTDWDEAHHALATARFGDDINAHKDSNCPVCWKRDPSYS
ncbi:hypothetical protein ACGFJT_37385 [Actinomadura geliboluensis]|uniref:hypothetical protein n=1 Tax=Actinomadura geliboluensis TaxID=882440 RepID=UPI003724B2AF